MHILSEKYRVCSPCKLIPCMQWGKKEAGSFWSVLFVILSAYETHTHLFYVTERNTFLALTRVPREIWQITEASLHGVPVMIQINAEKTSRSVCMYQTYNSCHFCHFLGYINLHWFTQINLLINSFNGLPQWSPPFGWKSLKVNLWGTHLFSPSSSSCIADAVQESREEPCTRKVMFMFCFWNKWPGIPCSQMRS